MIGDNNNAIFKYSIIHFSVKCSNERQHEILNSLIQFMLYTYRIHCGLLLIKFA